MILNFCFHSLMRNQICFSLRTILISLWNNFERLLLICAPKILFYYFHHYHYSNWLTFFWILSLQSLWLLLFCYIYKRIFGRINIVHFSSLWSCFFVFCFLIHIHHLNFIHVCHCLLQGCLLDTNSVYSLFFLYQFFIFFNYYFIYLFIFAIFNLVTYCLFNFLSFYIFFSNFFFLFLD